MTKTVIALSALLIFLLLLPLITYARSGCCSHHGGVCGCGCCDGTGLSATCAPYYPECNSAPSYVAPVYIPPVPTITSTTSSKAKADTLGSTTNTYPSTVTSKSDDTLTIVTLVGAAAFGGWAYGKRKKKA